MIFRNILYPTFGVCGMLTAFNTYAVTVDDFTIGSQSLIACTDLPNCVSPPAVSAVFHGDMIGGTRMLELSSSSLGPTSFGITRIDAGGSGLSFSNTPLWSGTGSVIWDTAGAGFGGVDLTDGGISTGFEFDNLYVDPNSAMVISVTDTFSNTASRTISSPNYSYPSFFLFSEFQNYSGTNFALADSIRINFITSASEDIAFNAVRTTAVPVPLPAAFWLFGTSLSGVFMMRSLKKK